MAFSKLSRKNCFFEVNITELICSFEIHQCFIFKRISESFNEFMFDLPSTVHDTWLDMKYKSIQYQVQNPSYVQIAPKHALQKTFFHTHLDESGGLSLESKPVFF